MIYTCRISCCNNYNNYPFCSIFYIIY